MISLGNAPVGVGAGVGNPLMGNPSSDITAAAATTAAASMAAGDGIGLGDYHHPYAAASGGVGGGGAYAAIFDLTRRRICQKKAKKRGY